MFSIININSSPYAFLSKKIIEVRTPTYSTYRRSNPVDSITLIWPHVEARTGRTQTHTRIKNSWSCHRRLLSGHMIKRPYQPLIPSGSPHEATTCSTTRQLTKLDGIIICRFSLVKALRMPVESKIIAMWNN